MSGRERAVAIEARLRREGPLGAVRRAMDDGSLEALLGVPPAPNSADAITRLETAVGSESSSSWLVKLAILVSEVPPGDTYDVLAEAGFVAEVKRVADILLGVAALRSLDDADDLEFFVEHHGPHLRQVLLFELSSSGGVSELMSRVATHAGLGGELAVWTTAMR